MRWHWKTWGGLDKVVILNYPWRLYWLKPQPFSEKSATWFRNECRFCTGLKAMLNHDFEHAKVYLEEDLAFRKGIGDLTGTANTLQFLGGIALSQNDWGAIQNSL